MSGYALLEIRREDGQLRLRPRQRRATCQAALDQETAHAAILEWVGRSVAGRQLPPHHQRREKVRADELIHPGEPLGRHADDRELDAVEVHRLSKDGGVGAELLLPELVPENGDGVAARRLILVCSKLAADLRCDAHDAKKLPETSRPRVSFGSASGVVDSPEVTAVDATSPSKLALRSRMSM